MDERTGLIERLRDAYTRWNHSADGLPEGAGVALEVADELTALRAENERLRKLVAAVKAYEFRGIECDDVAGVNWFDARDAALAGKEGKR